MSVIAAEQELYRACHILFGSEINFTRDFLQYLQPSGIKSAFRKKAFETHPDLHTTEDEAVRRHSAALFRTAQRAYEDLCAFLDARDKGFRLPAEPDRAAAHGKTRQRHKAWQADRQGDTSSFTRHGNHANSSSKNAGARERLYNGPMPERPLLFGHFLYYTGIANWRQIVQALIWQRSQRPRLGEIAVRFGWLTGDNIAAILKSRQPGEPFGQTAVNLGLLTDTQRKSLIYRQNCLQRKLGEFFVEKNIVTAPVLNNLLRRHLEHNRRRAKPSAKFSGLF